MADLMTFPDTVDEFMESYKITDTEHIYTNGAELVPIFRMKQWFEHSADVAPVRRGRWIIDRAFGNDVMSNEQMVICSECHKGIFWGKQNYCPNCGAKMGVDECSQA